MLISRARESRMGNLIVRPLNFHSEKEGSCCILAVEGWIPEDYDLSVKKEGKKEVRGILR